MRKVSISKSADGQMICLPDDMEYMGVAELEVTRDGDVVTLRPARPSWLSFAHLAVAEGDFLLEREEVAPHTK